MNTGELNKTEKTEPMMMTWGRIRALTHELRNDRLTALVEKLNKDMSNAKIEENHFNNVDWNEVEGINRTAIDQE